MPPKNYKNVLCDCSQCITNTVVDDTGQHKHGTYQRPGVAQQHRQRDLLQASREEQEVNMILFEAMAPPPVQAGELSVRHRDVDMEELHNPEMVATMQVDEISASSAASISAIEPEGGEDEDQIFRTIAALQSGLLHKTRRIPRSPVLVFDSAPTALDELPSYLSPSYGGNTDLLAVRDWVNTNEEFLDLQTVPADRDAAGRVNALKHGFQEARLRIQTVVELAWEQEKVKAGLYGPRNLATSSVEHTERWFRSREFRQPLLLAALLLTTVLHTLASVLRPHSGYVLVTLKAIIYSAFVFDSSRPLSTAKADVLRSIPSDIRTVLKRLDLEPDYKLYACCQTCYALHPPNPQSPDDPYPRTCMHQSTPGDPPCHSLLVKRSAEKKSWVPLKSFALQSLRSWLGQLLSCPGIERVLEASWKPSQTDTPGLWADIMEAPAIRQFIGPDGRSLFSQQPNGSIHLVFSLFVDWFNPFGNKKAGKSHSVGGVYMVCLNLPPELRYRTENIFLVGIIPGPHEPSLEQLNHFLGPLVDELLTLWTSGVFLSKTAARSTGRLVRAVVIPLVCDLPALRKVAGFAGHSNKKHFCSFCQLSKDAINNLDRPSWRRRTWAEHLAIATRWRDASTSQEREQIFDQYGLRWSELLRLPYWDPTRYALVDAMHNLYLGELRHHCMEVLGIDVKDKPTESKRRSHTPEEQGIWLRKVATGITRGSATALRLIRKGYIVAVADLNGVAPVGTSFVKNDYINALLAWYETYNDEIKLPSVLEVATNEFHSDLPQDISKLRLLNAQLLQEIRADIKNTFTPSWLEAPPSNFGSPGHGKLKAAQWRTVCTVNMVITLIRIWGTVGSEHATKRNRQLLHNFMDLVLAVEHATRRSMSPARAAQFDAHILRYLETLVQVFDHNLVPNHHLSLHLRECMELFGPVQAWWAFPFERYNGIIAQLKHNNKSAEMPLTFLRYFCIGSSLRWLMSSLTWPSVSYFTDMVDAYHTAFGNTLRKIFTGASPGSQSFTYDSKAEAPLSQPIYNALLSRLNSPSSAYTSYSATLPGSYDSVLVNKAQFVKKLTLETGLAFGSSIGSKRNSFIIFRDGNSANLRPGQIQRIFYHQRYDSAQGSVVTEPFFVVNAFEPLTEAHGLRDPYRVFDGLNTSLFYARTMADSFVLRQDDIVSHFAAHFYTPVDIEELCVVVRSLDRE